MSVWPLECFLHIEFYSKIRDISGFWFSIFCFSFFWFPSSGFLLLAVVLLLVVWNFGTSGLSFASYIFSWLLVWVWVNYTARQFLMILQACWVSVRLRRQAFQFFNKKITGNPHYLITLKNSWSFFLEWTFCFFWYIPRDFFITWVLIIHIIVIIVVCSLDSFDSLDFLDSLILFILLILLIV